MMRPAHGYMPSIGGGRLIDKCNIDLEKNNFYIKM